KSIRPGRSGAYLVLAVSSLSLGRADERQCRRAPPLGTGRNGFTESCSLSGNERSFVTVDPGPRHDTVAGNGHRVCVSRGGSDVVPSSEELEEGTRSRVPRGQAQ